MSIEFYLISLILCIICYFLFNILKKRININMEKALELLNFSIDDKDRRKIGAIYNFLILFLLLLVIKNYLSIDSVLNVNIYSNTVFLGNKTISNIEIAIIFFLLGLLCANLKKFVCYYLENFSYLLNCLALTTMTMIILRVNKFCISPLVIIFSIINLICFVHLFKCFKKEKMEGLEFIFNFILLLTINFINCFILIYEVWI